MTPNGGTILRSPTPGPALFVDCRVADPRGRPILGVEVDAWQFSPVGLYENQDPDQADMNLRGRFVTNAEDLNALDDRMFAVNWRGQLAATRAFAPMLRASG